MKYQNGLSLVTLLAALILCAPIQEALASEDTEIIIGSGGRTGVYYPVANSICRLVNAGIKQHGTHCKVETTGGSVDNLNKLKDGSINFAIAQSDWQSHAFKGTDVFKKLGPDDKLRSVFSLYPETFTILARSNSKITNLRELKNKNINIGNPGSGQRATMDIVMRAMGWDRFSFASIREFNSQYQSQALCDGEVDAIVFVAGHPSGSIKSATSKCDTVLIDVTDPAIDKLISENDYYSHATIPVGMYRGQDTEVKTFGVSATLVSSSETKASLVKLLVSSVFENIKKFRVMHPALVVLNPKDMMKNGLSAPLHDVANTYYKKLNN